MELGELRGFVEPEKLKFSIGGRRYIVAAVSGADWLLLHKLQAEIEGVTSAPADEVKLTTLRVYEIALGDQFAKIQKNETGADLQRAGTAAYYWQLGSNEGAEAAWKAGGKAETPGGTATRRPTRQAAASTTRKPASGTGTTSRSRKA